MFPNITSIKVKPITGDTILSTISDYNNMNTTNNNNEMEEIDPFKHTIEINCLQWIKVRVLAKALLFGCNILLHHSRIQLRN